MAPEALPLPMGEVPPYGGGEGPLSHGCAATAPPEGEPAAAATSVTNWNLSFRTENCPVPFRAAAGADGIAHRTVTHWLRALPAKFQFVGGRTENCPVGFQRIGGVLQCTLGAWLQKFIENFPAGKAVNNWLQFREKKIFSPTIDRKNGAGQGVRPVKKLKKIFLIKALS